MRLSCQILCLIRSLNIWYILESPEGLAKQHSLRVSPAESWCWRPWESWCCVMKTLHAVLSAPSGQLNMLTSHASTVSPIPSLNEHTFFVVQRAMRFTIPPSHLIYLGSCIVSLSSWRNTGHIFCFVLSVKIWIHRFLNFLHLGR